MSVRSDVIEHLEQTMHALAENQMESAEADGEELDWPDAVEEGRDMLLEVLQAEGLDGAFEWAILHEDDDADYAAFTDEQLITFVKELPEGERE